MHSYFHTIVLVMPLYIHIAKVGVLLYCLFLLQGCIKDTAQHTKHIEADNIHLAAEGNDILLSKTNQNSQIVFKTGKYIDLPESLLLPQDCLPKSVIETEHGYNLILETHHSPIHTLEVYMDNMKREGWNTEKLVCVSNYYVATFAKSNKVVSIVAGRSDERTKIQLTEISISR